MLLMDNITFRNLFPSLAFAVIQWLMGYVWDLVLKGRAGKKSNKKRKIRKSLHIIFST